MEKKFNFVFITTNLINGKQYVGEHSTDEMNSYKTKKYLGSGKTALFPAIEKYGRKNFKREILEFFPTKKEAFDAQAPLIKKYNTITHRGYNISPTGGSQCRGSWSEESKQKMRKLKTGRKLSEETKKKISDYRKGKTMECMIGNNFRKGKLHTEESKQKMREAAKNRPIISEGTRLKISLIHKGRNVSEETREKIRIGNKNKIISEESKQKMRKAKIGKKMSEESKIKRSEYMKKIWEKRKNR